MVPGILNEKILPLAAQLAEQVAKNEMKAAKETYKKLEAAARKVVDTQDFKLAPNEGVKKYLKRKIREKIKETLWNIVEPEFTKGILEKELALVEGTLNKLKRCVYEFNKDGVEEYFFVVGINNQFKVRDFVDQVFADQMYWGIQHYRTLLTECLRYYLRKTNVPIEDKIRDHFNNKLKKIMQLFVDNGADINKEFEDGGQTTCALRKAPKDALQFLLENLKADPNKRNKEGELPIAVFVDELDLEGVKTLIEHKSEYKNINSAGDSVLHAVVRKAEKLSMFKDLIAYLVKKDPKLLSTKNKAGKIPVECVKSPEVLAYLLDLHNLHKQEFDQKVKQNIMKFLGLKLDSAYLSGQQELRNLFSKLNSNWETVELDDFLKSLAEDHPYVKKMLKPTEFKMDNNAIAMTEIRAKKETKPSVQALQGRMARTNSGSPIVSQSQQVNPQMTTDTHAIQLPSDSCPVNRT